MVSPEFITYEHEGGAGELKVRSSGYYFKETVIRCGGPGILSNEIVRKLPATRNIT